MRRIAYPFVLAAALALVPAAPAAGSGLWIHVAVDERGPDGGTVRVNVPIELVTRVLPLIRHENLDGGKVRLGLGHEEMSAADLRAVWEAVRASRDGEYVTVDGPKERVRVAKRGGLLLVQVDGSGEKTDKVEARVPLAAIDALFSGTGKDELDLAAAVEALAQHGGGEFVTVDGDDGRVRIWIDSRESVN